MKLPKNIRIMIRNFWLIHPREADLNAYIRAKRLIPIKTFYCQATDGWITSFKPSTSSPCGIEHRGNTNYVWWQDIRGLMRTELRSVEGTTQSHAVVQSAWGKLIHRCHDEACSGKQVEVDYYGHLRSYAEVENLILPDWLYSLAQYKPVVVFNFLAQRIFGATSDTRKVYFHNGQFLCWDGLFWSVMENPSELMRGVVRAYIGRSREHLSQQWEQFQLQAQDPRIVDLLAQWIGKILAAIEYLDVSLTDPAVVDIPALQISLRANPSQFDGVSSKNIVICGSTYINLRTGEVVPPNPLFFATRRLLVQWPIAVGTPYVDMVGQTVEDEPLPEVYAYLRSLFADRGRELDAFLEYLQTLLGYVLTGLNDSHKVIVLQGAGGNGKSVFVRLLKELLQDPERAPPVSSALVLSSNERTTFEATVNSGFTSYSTAMIRDTLLKQTKGSSNGHTGNMMPVVGKRFIFVDELNSGDIIDSSALRFFSGKHF